MKPKILKVTGINSFNEEQVIDFSKLMSNGLFGIFGDTGSGKSTIIDCITLALYGSIARHKSKNRNGDFINLNRNNAKVEFEFSIKEGTERKNFSILRQFKKDKDGNIKTDIVRFINLDKNEIISDKKKEIEACIINIIGLNYEDFTKAVVLPQGKFSEFLMLENLEKRKMLERIFGLEKYGEKLTKKINEKKVTKQREVEVIRQKIGVYENITPEILEEKKLCLLEEENILRQKQEEIQKILEKERILQENYNLKKDFINYDEKFKNIFQYKDKVENMKTELQNSKKANIIKPYILELEEIEKECHNLEGKYNEIKKHSLDLKEQHLICEKSFKEIDLKYKNEIPKLEKIKLQLTNCIKWEKDYKDIELHITQLSHSIQQKIQDKIKFELKLKNLVNDKDLIKNNITELENFKEKNKIDIIFKNDLENGISILKDYQNINKSLQANNNKIEQYKKNISQDKESIFKLDKEIEKINIIIKNILISNKINLENELFNICEIIKKNDFNIESIKKDIQALETQIKLQENKEFVKELAQKLNDGEECPICGSKNHPNPANIFLDIMSESLLEQKKALLNDIEKIEEQKKSLLQQETLNKKYIEDIKLQLSELNLTNIENKLDKAYILDLNEIFKNIDKNNKSIAILMEKKSAYLANSTNSNNLIKDLEFENTQFLTECQKLNFKMEDIKQKLQISDFYYENEKLTNIQNEIILKDNELKILREKFENILNNELKLKNEISDIEKSILFFETSLKEKQITLKSIEKNINENSYGKDFNLYFKEINDEIISITENEKNIKTDFQQISNKLENVKIEFENINTKREVITKACEEKNNKLQAMLLENKLTKNEVLEKALNKKDEDYREDKIASFEEKINDYKINLNRISEKFLKLNKKDIKEINILDIEQNLLELKNKKDLEEKEKNNKIANIAKLDFEIKDALKALEITGELQNQLKEKVKKLDLLEELSKLNQGGLFVEYIANRQLKHIVLDASKRLEFMSQNKYSLELIDGSFSIKDHFNGSISRSPRSLSGGEIFMASLSLALALSSKIQLKNKSPLEVFFLDEGFGTLDSFLLDTVINTLEQLQNNNIDVGIISHVEEIKNRVHNKIIVKNRLNNRTGAVITFD